MRLTELIFGLQPWAENVWKQADVAAEGSAGAALCCRGRCGERSAQPGAAGHTPASEPALLGAKSQD